MKRKSILLMSMALLAGTLAGCGSDNSASTSPTGGDSTPTSTPVTSTAPESTQTPDDSTVVEKLITGIEIENYPSKIEYEMGEEFGLYGVSILVHYSDGSEEEIAVTLDMIKEMPDMTTSGKKTIYIVYEGFDGYEGDIAKYDIEVKKGAVEKSDPTIVFSIESGEEFIYDGTGEAPIINAYVLEDVNYNVWFEEDEVEIGESVPTTPGTYAIVVRTEENELYNSVSDFRWFVIKAPSNKVKPTFSFTYENDGEQVALENGTHFVEGDVPTLTAKANEEGVQFEVYYTKDDGETDLGSIAPTTPGTYAINIRSIEDDDFDAKVEWRWYVIDPAPEEGQISVHLVGDEVVFAYDGLPHTPVWHFEDEEGNVVDNVQYTLWYSSDDTGYNSAEAPTEVAWYGMTVTITDDVHVMSGNAWVTFHIDPVDAKPAPEISFTVNSGDVFYYDGTGEAPLFMAFAYPSDITYTTHFEKDEVNIGEEVPTEPGVYAFVCETEETNEYRAHKAWVIFTIAAPEAE